jgi:hypothetical protein
MTPEQLQDAQSRLSEIETEANAMRTTEREAIDSARAINTQVRALQAKIRAADSQAIQLRAAIREHEQAEKVKKAQEAAAKAEDTKLEGEE